MSQLDALHLELLHAAIPQQYDTIGVMMPGVAGRIGCRASAYRSGSVFAVRAREMWTQCLRHF
ncbi:MAG: hypothetical protein ACLT49_11690 [Sutterella wadsworthensis]